MEVIVAVSLLVLVFGLPWVRHGRWRFRWSGHEIDVRNYVFSERIRVDGRVWRTRRSTDHMTWAQHQLEVDGKRLRIDLRAAGLAIVCHAHDGHQSVFRSDAPTAPPPVPANDPRLVAARVLVAGIRRADPAAADVLARSLRDALTAEQASLESDPAQLAKATAAVDEVMARIRAVHLRHTGVDDTAAVLERARTLLAQQDADREVETVLRRASERRSRG